MASSTFHRTGSTAGWRHHQTLTDLEASPVPDRFRTKSALGLNAVRMSLRKRMPLKEVEANFDANPTWESLEAKEKKQSLRALGRRARNAFGAVSQKLQGPARLLAASLAPDPRASARGPTRSRRSPPRTPRRRSGRLPGATTPTSSTRIVSPLGQGTPTRPGSGPFQEDLYPLRRSMRAAALRSPYGSPFSAGYRRQFDRDLELVSSGIRQLERLSRSFNDIIVQEESDMTVSLISN